MVRLRDGEEFIEMIDGRHELCPDAGESCMLIDDGHASAEPRGDVLAMCAPLGVEGRDEAIEVRQACEYEDLMKDPEDGARILPQWTLPALGSVDAGELDERERVEDVVRALVDQLLGQLDRVPGFVHANED